LHCCLEWVSPSLVLTHFLIAALKASVLQERVDGVLGLLKCWSLEASSVNLLAANGNTESADGSRGCCGAWSVLWWSSEKLNVQLRQAPFAHHRDQVGASAMGRRAPAHICWRPVLLNHGITPGDRRHLHHPRSRCHQL
jgi:hypothetical protein